MRFTKFYRRVLASGLVEAVPFAPEHFREAGVGYAPVAGMPILEAFQLVNKWNLSQSDQQFVFAL